MISLGIDIGTTSICAVLYDLTEDKIIKSLSTPNSFINTGSYLQDPDRIVSLAKELLKELLMEFKAWAGEHEARNIRKPAGVGISSQMHGILYTDRTGRAVSPLYTWKNEDGNQRYRDGLTYARYLVKETGLPFYTGYGSVTHFYLQENQQIPDEAVALGAAIQGAMKSRNREVREMILTDVCAFTLGTEVVRERREGVYEAGHFCPIIERNTVIPASRTERFYTIRNNQDRIRIEVYQGESRLTANNLLLGSLDIQVPKNKAGAEAVDVTYTYDINSILEVEVKVVSTGKVKKQIIKGRHNTMTDEQIKARMEELSYLKVPPRDQEENRLLLLLGEQCYEKSTGEQRSRIERLMQAFEAALDSRDGERIRDAGDRLKACLEG